MKEVSLVETGKLDVWFFDNLHKRTSFWFCSTKFCRVWRRESGRESSTVNVEIAGEERASFLARFWKEGGRSREGESPTDRSPSRFQPDDTSLCAASQLKN